MTKKHVRRWLFGFVVSVPLIAVILFFMWPKREFQTLLLLDGTRIRFLGMTHAGTNHWNPSIAPGQKAALRAIGQLAPRWAASLSPHVLNRPENSPTGAVIPGTSSVVLWFWSDSPQPDVYLIVRCVADNGEELSPAYNVRFPLASKAAIVWLAQISDECARRVRYVEVYRRNAPLRHDGTHVPENPAFHDALNPVSEMELDPGYRVGRFEVLRTEQ